MWWIFFILFIVVASMAYAAVSAAPWVPTRRGDIARFLDLIEVKSGMKLYELGCGDARLVVASSKQFGIEGVGVELSILQMIAAKIRVFLTKANVKILWRNLFKVDLSDADIVYLFLMPEAYEKIRSKFEAELKSGTWVISYVWPIPEWEPIKVDKKDNASDLYVYRR
mgnify:CR=1 FL=1